MIASFTGRPGTGKTVNMVRVVSSYFQYRIKNDPFYYKNPPIIYSNIHIRIPFRVKNYSQICYYDSILLTKDNFVDRLLREKNAIFAIDEAGYLFNSRHWQKLPFDVTASFQQSRHKNIDILYTTQNIKRVDTTLRELTHFVYECECFPRTKELTKPRTPIIFRCSQYYEDIIDSQSKETYNNSRISTKYLPVNLMQKYFKMYDTNESVDFSVLDLTD